MRYMDASTYGIEANNIVRRTVENYRSAHDAISQAELQLEKLATKDSGKDTKHLKSLVDKAYALFSIGKYYESKLSADAVMLQSNLYAPSLADAGLEASAVSTIMMLKIIVIIIFLLHGIMKIGYFLLYLQCC